jgi:hypothetical protein
MKWERFEAKEIEWNGYSTTLVTSENMELRLLVQKQLGCVLPLEFEGAIYCPELNLFVKHKFKTTDLWVATSQMEVIWEIFVQNITKTKEVN